MQILDPCDEQRVLTDLRVSQQTIEWTMFLYDLTQLVLCGNNILDVQHIVEPIQLETHVSTVIIINSLSLRPDQSSHFSKQRLPEGVGGLLTQQPNQNP